jgi:glycine dehydrogenase subunit 2
MRHDYNKVIFELSKEGRVGYSLPEYDIPKQENAIDETLLRKESPKLPEVSENEVVRHYTNLSNKNYGVDTGFYPLGSCTMKYNPKINEDMARLQGFTHIHPLQDQSTVQGALKLTYDLQNMLSEITGLDKFSLNPFAGAHGELAGLFIMRAYHNARGDFKRTKIIVPDSAHGTNPASATVAGLTTVEISSNPDGTVNIDSLKENLSDEIAGIMLTNPNTAGMFERDITEIAALVHEAGGLLYYDGANLNPIIGQTRPGDMGFDVIHLNLHKTFSTPHGGGGPGSGPVGVKAHLAEYLPNPFVVENDGKYELISKDSSIGAMTGFYGNFGVYVRAYTYILTMGRDGLADVGKISVLNANYIQALLKDHYELPIDKTCMHEFVLNGLKDKSSVVNTLDVSKRLLDFGYHPPTVYFPLTVEQAIMVEPTETENKEMLDAFVEVFKTIAEEAKEKPEFVKNAPYTTPVRRIDEATAARKPIVKFGESLK